MKGRVAGVSALGPLGELDLGDVPGARPAGDASEARCADDRRRVDVIGLEQLAETTPFGVGEARADLAGVVKATVALLERDEQASHLSAARAQERQVSHDGELLAQRALDLEPRGPASTRVRRPLLLGDDALEAGAARRAQERLGIAGERGRRRDQAAV